MKAADIENLLKDFCSQLADTLNFTDPKNVHTVVYDSGSRPHMHVIPDLKIGNNLTIPGYRYTVWHAELRVNGKCIFRETYYYSNDVEKQHAEETVLRSLMYTIFQYGVMLTKNLIDERDARDIGI